MITGSWLLIAVICILVAGGWLLVVGVLMSSTKRWTVQEKNSRPQ
jgi:hypothetical protein